MFELLKFHCIMAEIVIILKCSITASVVYIEHQYNETGEDSDLIFFLLIRTESQYTLIIFHNNATQLVSPIVLSDITSGPTLVFSKR